MLDEFPLEQLDNDIREIIIGIIAIHGATGCDPNTIINQLSSQILDKYRLAAAKPYLSDEDIVRILLGKMVQQRKIKTEAPGGIVRFVLCTGGTISM